MKDRKTITLAFEVGSDVCLYPVYPESKKLLTAEFGKHFVGTLMVSDLADISEVFSILIVD